MGKGSEGVFGGGWRSSVTSTERQSKASSSCYVPSWCGKDPTFCPQNDVF